VSGPFLSTVRRPRRRARKALVALGVAGMAAVALGVAFGAIALLERGSLPRGATIGGIDVGGMSEGEAREAVRHAAAARVGRQIRLVAPDGELAATSGRELRAEPLVDEAVDAAGDEGVFGRVLDRTGLRAGPSVGLEYRLGPVPVAKLADRLDRRFGAPWRDARVVVGAEAARVVDARAGEGVDRHALRRRLRRLPSRVELEIVPIRPVVSRAEAEVALARIQRLLDGPRRVRFRDAEATLTPRRLRGLVRAEREDGSLGVSLDPKGLGASLRIRLGRYESAPRDATFAVGAARVSVVRSRPGRALDVERIGRSLVSNLESTTHLARFAATSPSFTTEQAERLDIRELVSEFTTYYSCCQPRVTNIQRAAQLLDGTVVLPGEAFSLNGALGKRTLEKGFVAAPQIFDGRLEDAVGGGISQVATTLYNAAFFAGVKLVAHQAHQFYISRYPMGREATVSWGGPELIFRNNWPAAILMKVTASDSAISVRFYSRKLGRRVETETGKPYAYTAPRTIRTLNSSLSPGSTATVQSSGESGFTVQYTRKVFRGDELLSNERYTVRYDPQNAIVEVGPPKRPPVKPTAKPKPDQNQPSASPPDAASETTATAPG
jgi:vancomycin resistance protein YoaR